MHNHHDDARTSYRLCVLLNRMQVTKNNDILVSSRENYKRYYERRCLILNKNLLKGIKIGVAIVGAGVALAQNYFQDKELDDKVAKAVEKTLKATTEEK